MERFDSAILRAMPDPALYIRAGRVVCCNQALEEVCPQLCAGAAVPEVLQPQEGSGLVALDGRGWYFTCSKALDGTLLLLHPEPEGSGLSAGQLDGVSRRMREQLSVLLMTIQLLVKSRPFEAAPSWEQRMAELNHSFCQMLRLVNHMDLLREMQGGSPPYAPVVLDLAGLCREVCEVAGSLLGHGGVELNYDSPLLTLLISGDPELLRHLLLELISNAARGAKRVTLDLAVARRGRQAVLTLTGDGREEPRPLGDLLRGISDGERIPAQGEGAGLGLGISQRIVSLHRGALMMERRPDSGLSVTVSLPLSAGDAPLSVHSPRAEYAGGLSPELVELSEVLPVQLFAPEELE